DDAAEPTTALAAENTGPALADSNIIRLRITVTDLDGQSSATWALRYSTDDLNWTAFGAANHWNYANGQATNGNATTTFKTSDGNVHGNYHEDGSGSEAITAGTFKEVDFAIQQTANAAAGTLYYFQVLIAGVGVALDTGKSDPRVTTAAAAVSAK